MGKTLIKILRTLEWEAFQSDGIFEGSVDDMRDGFIHLSFPEQVAGTLDKHFAGEQGLILLIIKPNQLDDRDLRFEKSRSGALFPHLYGPLYLEDIAAVEGPDHAL